ncbi:hypothetical protein PI125_g11783 [Phytophthora idaei]|nr:hypothetical protein PI125_g11783 [Phytophthora idaei]KAG3159324.1 hypothetical protein PI126_g7417 [Phytophthora idaei]
MNAWVEKVSVITEKKAAKSVAYSRTQAKDTSKSDTCNGKQKVEKPTANTKGEVQDGQYGRLFTKAELDLWSYGVE